MRHTQKIVVGAFIVKDKKVLILKRNKDEDILPNIWELPSGKVEFGESVSEALVREVKEETGLDVSVVKFVNTFSYIIKKKTVMKHTIQINFIVKEKGGELSLSEEHDQHAWITHKEIDDYEITEKTKGALRSAFKIM